MMGSRCLRSESIPRFLVPNWSSLRASALTDLGYSWSLTPELRLLALLRRCQAQALRQTPSGPTTKIMRMPGKEIQWKDPSLLPLRPKQVLGGLAMSLTPVGGCWWTKVVGGQQRSLPSAPAPPPRWLLLVGKSATTMMPSSLSQLCKFSSSTQPDTIQ